MKKTNQTKEEALVKHWDCNIDDIETSTRDDDILTIGSNEFLVLTDEEADEKTTDYIKDSLWAFNASFIIENSDLPWEAEEMVKSFQEKLCEGANETIKALIPDIDSFVYAAIGADGRGHFLSTYDGNEVEIDNFFIYQVN